MAIALAKKYLPLLDEVYKKASVTSILDAPSQIVRESLNAKEILLPSIVLEGLANYNRATGYDAGDVTLTWETHQFTQDRGKSFIVDAMDNAETIDVAFGAVSGQFVRTKVAPEIDAYRFATMASKAGGNAAAVLTKDTALQAIDVGLEALVEAEVPEENIVIFVSPKVKTFLKQSNLITRQFVTNVGTAELNREVETLDGKLVITVPQSRFYSAITIGADGYVKDAEDGEDINFLIADANAVLGIVKHAPLRVFTPEENQDADAWKFNYRLYHDLFVPANKVDGLYVHTVA
jgi:hypothetical protein